LFEIRTSNLVTLQNGAHYKAISKPRFKKAISNSAPPHLESVNTFSFCHPGTARNRSIKRALIAVPGSALDGPNGLQAIHELLLGMLWIE
jgi:hypothetical protein